MFKTKDFVYAEVKSNLAENEPMPSFRLIDDALCKAIDRLANIARKQEIIKPHEISVFDEKLKS